MTNSLLESAKQKMIVIATAFGLGKAIRARAQKWTGYLDWAATNSDTDNLVDCRADYLSMGVGYATVAGGRSAVINEALFTAYKGNVGHAFQLVLLTQCHNSEARQQLQEAGPQAVVEYLVENWSPGGVDPKIVREGVQTVLAVMATS
jgi:hypothetical protein